MRKIIKPFAVIVLTFTLNTAVQAQKIAHIAMDSLITIMPESKKAQDVAQTYAKDLEKVLSQMQTEFETKYQEYTTNGATYSDLIKKTKEEELQKMNENIQAFRTNAQQDYQKKYAELSKPIYEKANKAIKEVAKEAGYRYVLDTSTGMVLFSEESDNIIKLVKKKLDSMPEAQLPTGEANGGSVKPAPAAGGTAKPAPKAGK